VDPPLRLKIQSLTNLAMTHKPSLNIGVQGSRYVQISLLVTTAPIWRGICGGAITDR
jgi:hypothetical protein